MLPESGSSQIFVSLISFNNKGRKVSLMRPKKGPKKGSEADRAVLDLMVFERFRRVNRSQRCSLSELGLLLISPCSVWEPPGCGASDEDNDRSGFSEHELLEILYDACNSSSTGRWHLIPKESQRRPLRIVSVVAGEVLASSIIHYLQSMTTQSQEQERLAALRHLLDPDCQDPHVSREAFHSIMREWITQCSQDR